MKKFILVLIVGLISIVGLCAPKNSPWKEIQTVLIPQTVEIHEGVTRSGNNKYWIEVEGIKVTIAPTNVSKFQKGEVKLELVKWQNTETKAYKYSTRQVKSSKASSSKEDKNIDLGRVF
jgi:hypothetical protein